jgi:hypothetical protein
MMELSLCGPHIFVLVDDESHATADSDFPKASTSLYLSDTLHIRHHVADLFTLSQQLVIR